MAVPILQKLGVGMEVWIKARLVIQRLPHPYVL